MAALAIHGKRYTFRAENTPAAIGIATMLYTMAHRKFNRMRRTVTRLRSMAQTTSSRLSCTIKTENKHLQTTYTNAPAAALLTFGLYTSSSYMPKSKSSTQKCHDHTASPPAQQSLGNLRAGIQKSRQGSNSRHNDRQ